MSVTSPPVDDHRIYVRTDEGQRAAMQPPEDLPRGLRTLLLLVDGSTTVAGYQQALSRFGDLGDLLGSLEDLGLVRVTAAAGPRSATPRPGALRASSVPRRERALPVDPAECESLVVGEARSMMTGFFFTHRPDLAMEVSLDLERLTHAELIVNLDDYARLVAPVGAPARRHLAELRALLQPELSL